MLKLMQSYFFFQKLFTHVTDKIKLKLAKYNKTLQSQLGLKFTNYQLFTENYIIYESKTKGKEYDYFGNLLYDGEYLKGERHGEGKEYYYTNRGIRFDGQFKNGKRWTGKGYDLNGVLIYEIKGGKGHLKEYLNTIDERLMYDGEYLNGLKNGKGKEYNTSNRCLKYEGEFYNGVRHGKGKAYNRSAILKYEGEFFFGKKWTGKGYEPNGETLAYEIIEGKGFIKQYYNTSRNIKYESGYLNGEINGKGKEYYDNFNNNLKFEGEFLNGKKWNGYLYIGNTLHEIKNGKEVIYENEIIDVIPSHIKYKNVVLNGKKREYGFDNKLEFEGEYLNGKRNGKGIEYYNNGELRYEGEFLDNKRNGYGKEYNDKGLLIFEGEYLYDQKRKGKEYIDGILEYEGDYLFDKKYNGKGYDENGNVIYELINGKGTVREYNYQGLVYEGEYLNGKRHGKGKEYNYNSGKLEYEGEFDNGKRVKKK